MLLNLPIPNSFRALAELVAERNAQWQAAMPFGGFKHGSMGREGVRFAYEDMTQPKVVCINRA